MKLDQLFEASEWRDQHYRQQAVNFFDQFVDDIRNIRIFPVTQRVGLIYTYQFNNNEYKIALVSNMPYDGGVQQIDGDNYLVVNTDPIDTTELNLIDEHDAKKLSIVLNHKKSIIIHELIHLFDAERQEGFFDRQSFDGSMEDYFNHPSELNAFYQEAVQKFQESLNKRIHNLEHFHDVFGEDFESVFGFFQRNFLDREFWENLTQENKRKIRKRFYNFYSETIPDLF